MRALAIVHQADAGPGVFAEQARAEGVALDSWRIGTEPAPPRALASYDAVISFGGAMHPDQEDRHRWLAEEKDLLRGVIERGTPLLGACLGAQVLCEAAGGSVRRLPDPEIGWFEVDVLPGGAEDPLLGALAPSFTGLQWHSYECLLPPGAVALARSEACLQAYRVGDRAWGIQFHAEVTGTDLGSWMDDWREDQDAVRLGLGVEALRAETERAIGPWNELGRALCARFLAVAQDRTITRS